MREKILQAAFEEFYRNGFQRASLERIAQKAGATKGALFHYFKTKTDLGCAVVDEVIQPQGSARWIAPVEQASDPVDAIQAAIRRNIRNDAAQSEVLQLGCALNTLSQELSAHDERMRRRIEASYDNWRTALVAALQRAQRNRQIREDAQVGRAAALVVASQMGIWGTAKNSHDPKLMAEAGEALCDYLESLKPRTRVNKKASVGGGGRAV